MVKNRALLAVLLVITLVGSATVASAAKPTVSQPAGSGVFVSNRIAWFDSPLTAFRGLRLRLVTALRISNGVVMVDLDDPNEGNDYQLNGINDGGDNVDPLGAKDNSMRQDGPIPVTASTAVR
jgi:hypothetical protein